MYDFHEVENYDLGIMVELVEHLENPLLILKKFSSVLKSDGVGFVTFAIRMPQIDHVYHFKAVEEAQKMLKKSGLKVVDDYYAISSLTYIPEDKRREVASNPKYAVNYCSLVKK